MLKLIFYSFVGILLLDACNCWVITDINTRMLAKSELFDEISDNKVQADGENNIQQRINIIFPGTKWCGAGNIAENYDDLGVEKEADICCREHDHCPDLISGGETKYNLTNEAFYTRLNCVCDNKFHKCLKAANTRVAKTIGVIYFNALQTQCFREDYPVTGCRKRGGWFNAKCIEYSYDKNGEKRYQWFDVKEF